MWKEKSSIETSFFNKMIFIVFVSISLWCLIWIHGEYSTFKSESEFLREAYLKSQKAILKKEVAGVVKYINDMRKQSEQKLEISLKERVYEAHQIAENIYQQNADSKDLPEIIKMIKDALRPIRFNGGRGYYFAVSMDGIDQLYPVSPEFEGKNVMGLQDSKGNFVVQNEMNIVKTKGEGFVKDFWTKPGKDPSTMYPKISFVKYFKPLDWYFGTGEYLDDAKEQIQAEVLTRIADLRFGTEGYFFGTTYQGGVLLTNGQVMMGAGNVWDLIDPNGKKVVHELTKAAENPDGGFVYYAWNKLDSKTALPKMSFVQGIDEWGWMIGAGVYFDTINKTILENKAALTADLKKRMIRSLLVLAALLCLVYFWSNRISKQIHKSVETFSGFLEKASSGSSAINFNDIQLKEFKELAVPTNKMLTDRKKAEKALRESEEKFRIAFHTSPNAMTLTRVNSGVYIDVNNGFTKMAGYTQEDAIGKTSIELNIWDDPKDRERLVSGLKNHGIVENLEADFRAKDGTIRIGLMSARILNIGKKDILFAVTQDITEKKKAEAEKINTQKTLAEHEKMALVGQVAGKMAHDFNNILGIIMGNTELSILDCEDARIKQTLELIYEQTLRGKNLTKNLVAFAKDQEPKQELFGINEKIDLVINLLRKDLEGIKLIRDDNPGVPDLLADPGMIEHAFVNLIQNSIHAISKVEFPSIMIRTYCIENSICLEIEDNGCGIPEEYWSHIFEPSFTLKGRNDATGSYDSSIRGTGYGMSNVKKYIELHKGTISFKSEVGSGTKFTIRLPVVKRELTHEEKKEIQEGTAYANKHILLLEDETAISDIQYNVLTQEPCNHKVDIANNGKVAMDLFDRNEYDFISLDYVLPGKISGMDVYHYIRKSNQIIPILFISGNIEFLESIKALKQKDINIDHQSKPCLNKDYVKSINELLERSINVQQ